MKPFLTAALVSLSFSLPAAAEDADYAARLAVANEYVTATVADMDMDRVIEQMWRGALPQFEQVAGGPLSDAQKGALQALYLRTFSEPMAQMMSEQDVLMARMLTLKEITALRDFYATPEGRSVMRKLPDIMGEQMPRTMEMVQSSLPKIMPELMAILQGK